jgi:hypothetical protein
MSPNICVLFAHLLHCYEAGSVKTYGSVFFTSALIQEGADMFLKH